MFDTVIEYAISPIKPTFYDPVYEISLDKEQAELEMVRLFPEAAMLPMRIPVKLLPYMVIWKVQFATMTWMFPT